MLMPSIFGENFMDDFFGVPERTYTQSAQNALMKTDVVENKDGFDVSIDLPGFKKEDVKGEVKDGYLIYLSKRGDQVGFTFVNNSEWQDCQERCRAAAEKEPWSQTSYLEQNRHPLRK